MGKGRTCEALCVGGWERTERADPCSDRADFNPRSLDRSSKACRASLMEESQERRPHEEWQEREPSVRGEGAERKSEMSILRRAAAASSGSSSRYGAAGPPALRGRLT